MTTSAVDSPVLSMLEFMFKSLILQNEVILIPCIVHDLGAADALMNTTNKSPHIEIEMTNSPVYCYFSYS